MKPLLVVASSLTIGLALSSGCGQSGRGPAYPGWPAADLLSDPGSGGDDLAMSTIDPGAGDMAANDPCSIAARLVYVVDENNKFSSFTPDQLTFTDIGTMNCPAQPGATPFSMAVDRSAVAWVLYSSGEIFQVDTKNAHCKSTNFVPNQLGFLNFGMGFVSNAAMSNDETLFIASLPDLGGSAQLGKIAFPSLKVSKVGDINGSPELTGNANAELWGFFPDQAMPRVSQLNKANGKEVKTFKLPSISGTPLAWAFAFWGGDFWIFLKRDTDLSTQVHHLRPSTGKLDTPLPDTNRTIVGAGVSTCAPVTIM